MEWADARLAAPTNGDRHGSHAHRAAEVLRAADTARSAHTPLPAQVAAAIGTAVWHLHDAGHTRTYLHRRSATRRWAPTEGQEWETLTGAGRWAEVWLASRLLLGGIPGTAATRGPQARLPACCWQCGSAARPKWRWLSPALRAPPASERWSPSPLKTQGSRVRAFSKPTSGWVEATDLWLGRSDL